MVGSPEFRKLSYRGACGLLVLLPVLPYALMALAPGFGFDLHVFWHAAQAVGHGNSPYDPAGVAHARVLAARHPDRPPLAPWAVYPPVLFAVMVPLGWLPWPVALTIGTLVIAVCPFVALRVMGVRDWRCYFAMYGSLPVTSSIGLGAISPLLMLGVALLWRGRLGIGAGIATLVAKLFLWPLSIPIAALEGRRRAVEIVVGSIMCTIGSWAIIGFADLTSYPRLLSDLSAVEAHNSFSTTGLAYALGLPLGAGTITGFALGGSAVALSYRAGRAGRRDDAFTYGLLAALLLSPIVWMHYLVLLFVPLAARVPRFGVAWLVPLALWGYTFQGADGSLFAWALFWACVTLVVTAATRPGGRPSRLRMRGSRTRVDPVRI